MPIALCRAVFFGQSSFGSPADVKETVIFILAYRIGDPDPSRPVSGCVQNIYEKEISLMKSNVKLLAVLLAALLILFSVVSCAENGGNDAQTSGDAGNESRLSNFGRKTKR